MPHSIPEIRSFFEELADPVNAGPMAAYMKHRFPFFGIKVPQRRALQKEVMAHYRHLSFDALCGLVRQLYAEPERELHQFAIDWLLARKKEFHPETIGLIRELICTNSWWDSVDTLAVHGLGYWCRRFPEQWKPVIRSCIASGDLWLQRSAIIHQLQYGPDTDTGLLEEAILPQLGSKEFFLQKAIGWALRQYGRHDAGWVRDFAARQPLAPLSRREALKHL